ncbi:hypothetical protein QFC20_007313 [Naganishia adeliensis]|uniref:Uncharacterized protein n=1 Tax=Naganishia adeliensis TaxID=92952 RepID=A0ACC2V1S3_9TREE|nr:hypothetical protein QFC20_007313 [Naganishia adeliensis]
MPHISERKRILDDLDETISALQLYVANQVVLNAGERLFEDDDMDLDEEEEEQRQDDAQDALQFIIAEHSIIEVLQEMRRTIVNRRYLEGRPVWRELAAERTTRIEGLFSCDNNWFKETCRLDYDGYLFVLDQIKDDPIFFNISRNPQAPVEYQLLVALSRFGHSGNSVGTRAVANAFRIAGERLV